jgi:protein PhnA
MSEEIISCPECQSDCTYPSNPYIQVCAECGHEWNPQEQAAAEADALVKDMHGNILQDGDTVIVMKDLPVKGSSSALKAGTKVKNIRLTDGDHNIDCKIDGFGAMGLKSEFVKKA